MDVIKFPSKYKLNKFVPERLLQALNYRAISKKDFSEKVGISVRELNKILKGNIKSLELIFKFSDVLNFPVTYFFKSMVNNESKNGILFIN